MIYFDFEVLRIFFGIVEFVCIVDFVDGSSFVVQWDFNVEIEVVEKVFVVVFLNWGWEFLFVLVVI